MGLRQPRTPDQREVVQQHFRTTSSGWGQRYAGPALKMSDLDLQLRRDHVHRLVRPLLAAASAKLRVLDLGCGTGDVLDGLPRDSIRVLGADLVPEMVAVAAESHPADRFMVCDAQRLPLTGASLDLVTSLGVLEYLPDPSVVLREISAVLRPGGHLVVSMPNRRSLFRRLSRLESLVERGLGFIRRGGRRSTEAAASPKYQHRQYAPADVRRLLDQAGFDVEALLFNTFGLWGRIGRWRVSLSLSRWLTHRLADAGAGSWLGCTMVCRARKRS